MQVLVIHGAGGFVSLNRADFVAALRQKKVSLNDLRRKEDWKSNLSKELGANYDVLYARMPDSDSPQYMAWAAWFEQMLPLLDPEVVFIGHSLGALFLVKYLSENKITNTVRSLHLAASPYTGPEVHSQLGGRLVDGKWLMASDLGLLADQCNKIYFYHSVDDPAVPYSAAEAYMAKLPHAVLRTYEGRGLLRVELLPGLAEDIKS